VPSSREEEETYYTGHEHQQRQILTRQTPIRGAGFRARSRGSSRPPYGNLRNEAVSPADRIRMDEELYQQQAIALRLEAAHMAEQTVAVQQLSQGRLDGSDHFEQQAHSVLSELARLQPPQQNNNGNVFKSSSYQTDVARHRQYQAHQGQPQTFRDMLQTTSSHLGWPRTESARQNYLYVPTVQQPHHQQSQDLEQRSLLGRILAANENETSKKTNNSDQLHFKFVQDVLLSSLRESDVPVGGDCETVVALSTHNENCSDEQKENNNSQYDINP